MAGMILFFPLNSHAQYELGYAVFHLSQKMLSEPSIAKDIDDILHKPVGYGIDFELKMEALVSGKALDPKRVQVVRNSLDALESHALEVVRGIKKMNPAKKNGEPVKCRFCIPITFKFGSGLKEELQSVKNIDSISIYK